MKTRTTFAVAIAALAGFGIPAPVFATDIIIPAGTRAEINIDTIEDLAAQLASTTVPISIPEATYLSSTGSPILTASVAAANATQKMSLNGKGGAFAAVNDTFTVGGSAVGSFLITMTLHVTGTYGTVPATNISTNLLFYESVLLEIGTFHHEATLNQFIIDPFHADAFNSGDAQTLQGGVVGLSSPTPVSFDLDAEVSYTKLVQVGDVFDIGYDVIAQVQIGQMDLTHTGTVSFTLPEGVFVDSALGAHFAKKRPLPCLSRPPSLWLSAASSAWQRDVAGISRSDADTRRPESDDHGSRHNSDESRGSALSSLPLRRTSTARLCVASRRYTVTPNKRHASS